MTTRPASLATDQQIRPSSPWPSSQTLGLILAIVTALVTLTVYLAQRPDEARVRQIVGEQMAPTDQKLNDMKETLNEVKNELRELNARRQKP